MPINKALKEAQILFEYGRFRAALAVLQKMDQRDPLVLRAKTTLHSALGEWVNAFELVETLIKYAPAMPDAWMLRGNILKELGQIEDALSSYNTSLACFPNNAICLCNRASVYKLLSKDTHAEKDLERAIDLDRNNKEARYQLAEILLSKGQFTRGWNLYESRLNTKLCSPWSRIYPKKMQWIPGREIVDGSTVLVYGEQGLGDIIQFSRFIPNLLTKTASIVLQVPQVLHRLFRAEWPDILCVDSVGAYQGIYDLHCSLMSLPELLAINEPPVRPWLGSNINFRSNGRLDKPNIGLVWKGAEGRDVDRYMPTKRSVPKDEFGTMVRCNIHYICLQVDMTDEDISFAEKYSIELITGGILDFYQTAEILKSIDLLISVDTSIVHLAGALGVDCFVLLPKVTDYRWAENEGVPMWYPGIKCFKQEKIGSWSEPIAKLAQAVLQKFQSA